jgi:hypothetical protein
MVYVKIWFLVNRKLITSIQLQYLLTFYSVRFSIGKGIRTQKADAKYPGPGSYKKLPTDVSTYLNP